MTGYISLFLAFIFTIAAVFIIVGAYLNKKKLWLPALITALVCILILAIINFIIPKL